MVIKVTLLKKRNEGTLSERFEIAGINALALEKYWSLQRGISHLRCPDHPNGLTVVNVMTAMYNEPNVQITACCATFERKIKECMSLGFYG